ncbi:MAG TPA: reverse transcriptase domain-containing protein, partial [Nitrososphaeraceae archaeon]|nr:reverse transcriptase domain-containing protein [Nitrososphaeraceae archaeon]
IYAPPKTQESNIFWEKINTSLNKKQGKNKHFIIGDLNVQLDKRDSNNGSKTKIPKGLKNIIKVNSLIDAYRSCNKNTNEYTYFQIQTNNTVQSKVDYTLVPLDMQHIWHSPKIKSINTKISQDHRAIQITLRSQISREIINKIEEAKQKKMLVKDLNDKVREKILEVGGQIFSSTKWKQILNKENKNIDINELLQMYEEDLWQTAEQSLEIKQTSNIPKLKPKKISKEKRENNYFQNVITKAILSIPNALITNKITKNIQNIYKKITNNKYKISTPANIEEDPKHESLKAELQMTLKELRNHSEEITSKETKDFIHKRVGEIRQKRIHDPNKFFARAQPDSVFSSQQLWTVEEETIKETEEGIEKTITTTSEPAVVAKKVKTDWEKVMTSKTKQSSYDHKAFETKKFKDIRKKIKGKDNVLTQEVSETEMDIIIRSLSNGTATGPDNIPNEIIKILYKIESFQKILLKIVNICIIKEKIPKKWKKSNIYTIYKKGNPNDSMNYRPIALLCTTYKIYSNLLTKRISTFMEDNNTLSNMQGGFRRDRPTFAKIWTLRNIIEHSIINNKEIHVCYIDIQKAYDSVEYWALNLILEKYDFNKKIRNIIQDICTDSTCNFILPYDLSDTINITRGVR